MNTNIISLTETPTVLTVRSNEVGRHRWLCANAGTEDIILHSQHHSRVVKRINVSQEWMKLATIQPRKHNGKMIGGMQISQSTMREWFNNANHSKEKIGSDWLILSFIDLASCQFDEMTGFTVENQNGLGLSVWKNYDKGKSSWTYKWYELEPVRATRFEYNGPTFAQPNANQLAEPEEQLFHVENISLEIQNRNLKLIRDKVRIKLPPAKR